MCVQKNIICEKQTINPIEESKSLCPSCMQIVQHIYTDGSRVFMNKTCPIHGSFQGIVWSDYQLYQRSFRFKRKPTKPLILTKSMVDGCPYDCGLCPEHKQHTCLAIIDVTDRCNLINSNFVTDFSKERLSFCYIFFSFDSFCLEAINDAKNSSTLLCFSNYYL